MFCFLCDNQSNNIKMLLLPITLGNNGSSSNIMIISIVCSNSSCNNNDNCYFNVCKTSNISIYNIWTSTTTTIKCCMWLLQQKKVLMTLSIDLIYKPITVYKPFFLSSYNTSAFSTYERMNIFFHLLMLVIWMWCWWWW